MTTRIAVTGAGGFIGGHILEVLRRTHEDSDLETDFVAITHEVDMCNKDTVAALFHGVDEVLHFAANIGGIGYLTSNAAQIVHDNLTMDLNVLEGCYVNGVRRLIMPSSVCVYGEARGSGTAWAEYMSTGEPTNYYGWGKLMMEKACEAYRIQYGMNIGILRLDTVYGNTKAKLWKEKVPEAMCRKVKDAPNGGEIEIWGDGSQTRQLLYIDDAVDAILKFAYSNLPGPINISGFPTSIDNIADTAIDVSGKTLTKKYDVAAPRGVLNREIDITKAHDLLKWNPKIGIGEGISKIYAAILDSE